MQHCHIKIGWLMAHIYKLKRHFYIAPRIKVALHKLRPAVALGKRHFGIAVARQIHQPYTVHTVKIHRYGLARL